MPLDDFVGQLSTKFGHVIKHGFEYAKAVGQAAKFYDEFVALRLRHVGLDFVPTGPVRLGGEADDLPAQSGEAGGYFRG